MTARQTLKDDYSASVEFYDFVPAYSQREDIASYLRLAKETGGTVLELGCGTGRTLLPIAMAGIPIAGLDSSPAMLEICSRRLIEAACSEKTDLVLSDMRDFDLGRKFNLITVPFRAFQHLETAEDQLACLSSVRRHLAGGGLFVLDLFNPDMQRIMDISNRKEYGNEEPFLIPDGSTVTRRFRTVDVDLPNQIMDCEIIYHIERPDGSTDRKVHSFRMRWLFRWEAEHLLERAGFSVVEVAGDHRGSPFGTDWPGELILKAVVTEI